MPQVLLSYAYLLISKSHSVQLDLLPGKYTKVYIYTKICLELKTLVCVFLHEVLALEAQFYGSEAQRCGWQFVT